MIRKNDIFITASLNDPCSNSLIEALHCGLPAIVRSSGGHPEIVKDAGEIFDNKYDVIMAIEKVATHYAKYRSKIRMPMIDEIGELYYNFAQKIHNDIISGVYSPKRITLSKSIIIRYKNIITLLHKFKKKYGAK